jgi:regulatory protein
MPQSAKPDWSAGLPGELVDDQDDLDDVDESSRDSGPSPRHQAMNWLARREYSLAELRDRLVEREYPPDVVEITVAALAADGLVSDERFAAALVAVRVRKGQGPVRIRTELKTRGVGRDLIRQHVYESGLEWHELACEVRRKKFGAMMPVDFKEKARQMRFLEYRGFSGEHIRSALGEE